MAASTRRSFLAAVAATAATTASRRGSIDTTSIEAAYKTLGPYKPA